MDVDAAMFGLWGSVELQVHNGSSEPYLTTVL